MPEARVKEQDGRLRLLIPCRYEGQNTRRYGETTIRFRIEEGHLPVAMRAVISADRQMVAVIVHNKEKMPIGKVSFGGLRITGTGESILSLETVARDMRLPTERISDLADVDIKLLLSIKV
jgi:hypothetical protein